MYKSRNQQCVYTTVWIEREKGMNRLKEIRKKNHLTQEQLATILGTSKANISSLEKQRTFLSEKMIEKIVGTLNCSADYLLGYVDENGNVEVRHEYDQLSDEERQVVDYYNRLNEQETKMVDELINAFNCVTKFLGYIDENEKSRYEYNKLSDEQKRLIDYYNKLSEENQDYIRGEMVKLYREQQIDTIEDDIKKKIG